MDLSRNTRDDDTSFHASSVYSRFDSDYVTQSNIVTFSKEKMDIVIEEE